METAERWIPWLNKTIVYSNITSKTTETKLSNKLKIHWSIVWTALSYWVIFVQKFVFSQKPIFLQSILVLNLKYRIFIILVFILVLIGHISKDAKLYRNRIKHIVWIKYPVYQRQTHLGWFTTSLIQLLTVNWSCSRKARSQKILIDGI